jgi:hypothetical protein
MVRTARWVTRAKTISRSSVNSDGGKAQRAVGRQQAQRHQQHGLLQLAARQGEAVDDVLEHHRHRDVGQLGQQQAGEREDTRPSRPTGRAAAS